MDSGEERVEDARERRALRQQARQVTVKALLFALITTALAMGTASLWP